MINNDFHLSHIENYSNFIDRTKCFVISIPYSLKGNVNNIAEKSLVVKTPFRDRLSFWNPLTYAFAKSKIEGVEFKSTDQLILLTEYDPLNQYAAYRAKRAGAKVYLLEEGIATYSTLIVEESDVLSGRDKLKLFYLKFVVGFSFINFLKMGNNLYPRMEDSLIDAVLLYRQVSSKRSIENIILTNPVKRMDQFVESSCLFLNQPLYESYVDENEYIQYLKLICESLSDQFEEVLFKFHPRDHGSMELSIKDCLSKYPNIKTLPIESSIDEVVETFRPAYAISFFSDALFKLDAKGVIPIFLFHFFSRISGHSGLRNVSLVLQSMGYTACFSLDNVCVNSEGEGMKCISSFKYQEDKVHGDFLLKLINPAGEFST